MDKEIIESRLREHLLEAMRENDVSDWFVIASNGSMNYNLDTSDSDIDSKLLTIPSLKQLINDDRNNYLYEMSDNGEHVEAKDIAIYMKTILKQNINFVETLFANGVIVNPKYQEEWGALIKNREKIARYDTHRAIKCMYGMMVQKQKDMFAPTPGRQESIDKIGYDAKSFHHLMRLYYFMQRYVEGCSYEDCLTKYKFDHAQRLVGAKLGGYTYKQALDASNGMIYTGEEIANKFLSQDISGEELHSRWDVKNLIGDVVYNVVEKSIKR